MTAPTASKDAEILASVQGQAAARRELVAHAARISRDAVASFDAWYDHVAIGKWARELFAQQQTVQRRMAATTDAYLSRVASVTAGRTMRGVGAVDVSNLRGVDDPVRVYGRPTDTYRFELWRGTAEDQARAAAVRRLQAISGTDVSMASRKQSQQFMQQRRIRGYRRVVHPELTDTKTSCGLCIVASENVYHSSELMPIHDRCQCEPMPIVGSNDPGVRVNKADLSRLYSDVGSTSAYLLKTARYRVNEHGEIGPVLTDADQAFRTAKQASRPDPAELTDEQARAALQSLERQLPRMRERAKRRPAAKGTLDAAEQRIRKLREQVAA